MRAARFCAIFGITAAAVSAAGWNVARTGHFDVYSDAPPASARALAEGLERLRAFFPPVRREVRVICFASAAEYAQYRTRSRADAYYLGTENRDYIVLPALPRGDLRVAAHEYAHAVLHSAGWKLPDWIAEGVSDVISTVHLGARDSRIGGDFPGRSSLLKGGKWMPLSELLAFRLDDSREDSSRTGLFYAESWAVADLLMLAPPYSARFPELLAALASGVPAERALRETYGTTPAAVEREARERVGRNRAATALPAPAGAPLDIRMEAVTPFDARVLLADLRYANGELALAETLYRGLAAERPAVAALHGALGTIALQRGDTGMAVREWKRAVDLGIDDAALCFRYAALADERGLPVRGALERAIALRPDFDDARFKLALLEKNGGHAEAAIAQLKAMRQVAPARAFSWWTSLADALLDLNRRAEAKQAAGEARARASNAEERERAAQLEWMAETELAVEIDGQKFRTVRVPVGAAGRNPFIEAGERAQRVEATLREVECGESGIRLLVDTPQGPLTLAVTDPSRVEIRNAGAVKFEFTCGAQQARPVVVDYAAGTLALRGLEFK